MGYLIILRPANLLFIGICVLFGAFYPEFRGGHSGFPVTAAAISAMLIGGAGYVINDYFDLEIDRINRPQRVLPAGRMTSQAALIYSIILFLLGIVAAFFTGETACVLLAVFNAVILFFYGLYFKRAFVSGNILVSYAAASTFIFGGIVTENLEMSMIIAYYAFIYTFLREIVKDMEDRRGDEISGAQTLALRLKKSRIMLIFLLSVILLIIGSGFLYAGMKISSSVLVLLMFLVILPLLLFYRILSSYEDEKYYKVISRLMKFDMLILLLIFATGSL